jgi:excisionase family DNA binding protein
MLRVADVARRLNCSVANAYTLIESGRLPHFRVGAHRGGIRVSEEQLQAFLDSAREGPDTPRPARPRLKHVRF